LGGANGPDAGEAMTFDAACRQRHHFADLHRYISSLAVFELAISPEKQHFSRHIDKPSKYPGTAVQCRRYLTASNTRGDLGYGRQGQQQLEPRLRRDG
jgi:hypothetical protein